MSSQHNPTNQPPIMVIDAAAVGQMATERGASAAAALSKRGWSVGLLRRSVGWLKWHCLEMEWMGGGGSGCSGGRWETV